jgi:hypothetical protein
LRNTGLEAGIFNPAKPYTAKAKRELDVCEQLSAGNNNPLDLCDRDPQRTREDKNSRQQIG